MKHGSAKHGSAKYGSFLASTIWNKSCARRPSYIHLPKSGIQVFKVGFKPAISPIAFGARRTDGITFVIWIAATREDTVKLLMALHFKSAIIILTLIILGWASFCVGQTPQPVSAPNLQNSPEHQGMTSSGEQPPVPQSSGSITGTVVDQSGAIVTGAHITLTHGNQSFKQEVLSGDNGQFSFANVVPGPFQLTITAAGFATQTSSGTLESEQMYLVPQIVLTVAANVTALQVGLPQVEVAEEEIKLEEQQRVLGVIPNFYVSYIPDAAPLNSKQKFKLAWRTVIDPSTLVVVAGAAGVEQAQNHFIGYGQGTEGYAKRLGAGYADTFSGTFLGAAILPSLLKQDPRYFYKGTGSPQARFLYAIANSVICKGDNKRWQPNYSNVLGNLAAGGISNLYYPAQDRDGAELTFENAAIGIASTAIANLFQEFVIKKLTPKLPNHPPANP